MRFFVSSASVDRPPAAELIDSLRAAGHEVDHSPRGLDDPRWPEWLAAECQQAIERSETFVVVQDWDEPTWMTQESELAGAWIDGRSRCWCTVYDPYYLHCLTSDIPHYDGLRLPGDLNRAVALLTCASCAAFGRDVATSSPRVHVSLGGWGFELTIESQPALEQEQHSPGKNGWEYWLLRCRDCGTYWQVSYGSLYDQRLIEPSDVTSVAQWRERLAPYKPRTFTARGQYVKVVLWVLAFVTAMIAAQWLKSR